MGVGDNIAKLRKRKGWTQKELAEAAGLSSGYISAIEEGGKQPTVKSLAIIAKTLGVKIERILK